jgi:hypothetical protein
MAVFQPRKVVLVVEVSSESRHIVMMEYPDVECH